mmetsp:Transcript_16761/g.16657  ORF Transcript_16761/g.16657 Transcript_16761/m.16657 type:complete len:1644 (-) Transcript_16761:43-4974(-)
MGSILISSSELSNSTDYLILVSCYTYCRYALTVAYTSEIFLIPGLPMSGNLTAGRQAVYKIMTENYWSFLEIAASATFGEFQLFVNKGDIDPTADNSLPIEHNWHSGQDFYVENPKNDEIYRAAIVALTDVQYTITATSPSNNIQALQASVPVRGSVGGGQCNAYVIAVDDPNETLVINLTPFSGDADIYVSAGKVPSITEFDFAARKYGNDTLVIDKEMRQSIGSPTGFYYISICGFMDSTYSLTVSINKNSFTPLTAGVPETGYVNYLDIDLFYFELQINKNYNITVQVTALEGNPDLYAKLCTSGDIYDCVFIKEDITNPGLDIHYSNHSTGSDTINIAHRSNKCSKAETCKYVIGVAGASVQTSFFTVVALLDLSSELRLQDGRPTSGSIQGSGYKYFVYDVFNITATQIDFSLTPIIGNPDLYVSTTGKPNITYFEKSSNKAATEIDSVSYVRGEDGKEDLIGSYHVAVYSASTTTFSIVAKETLPIKNTTIQLYPGHPQKDTVYNVTDGDYRIYYFTAHYTAETKQPFRITLTPITGKYSIYAANSLANLDWNTEIFFYNWRSDSNSTDITNTITIDTNDPAYLLTTTYLVLVIAEQFSDDSATYSIVYSIGDGVVILSEDIPYNGQVEEKKYDYYRFPVFYNHEDITITVTALTGDPDLYITASPEKPQPSKSDNEFRSNNFGSEVLTITWGDIQPKCPTLPDQYTHGSPTNCNLYIAVYGFSASTYTIKIHPRRNLPSPLMIGTPEIHQVNKTQEDYYYVTINAFLPLSVTSQPLQGDPDLFMNIFDVIKAGYDLTKWQLPTRTNSSYWSQSTVMTDEIDISSGDLLIVCPSGNCIALIGVYCFSDSCMYSLNVQQEEITIIYENVPTYGYADQNQYVYYSYYCDKDDTDFLITVTPLSNGDPDLFISMGRAAKPTRERFDWASQNWSGESLLISKDSPFFNDKLTMRGTYIIGVLGVISGSFTLTVNNHIIPVTRLYSGIPQQGRLAKNSAAYYSFFNTLMVDIVISLVPTTGTPTLLASYDYGFGEEFFEQLPSLDHYTWSSITANNRYVIYIPASDPYFCTYCNILIAVNTTDSNCTYSITANNNQTFTVLQNGIPFRSNIMPQRWQFYSFEITERTDFDILFTSFSGDIDAYVSTNKSVNYENSQWFAFSSQKIDFIGIKTSDTNFIVGTYYIGINTYLEATYSVMVHTRNTYATLVDGWPVTYGLEYSRSQKVYFQFGNHFYFTGPVFCTLTPLSPDFWPRVYADFQPSGQRKDFPNQFGSKYKFEMEQYDPLYDELQMSFHETGFGSLNIAVYGSEHGVHSEVDFGQFDLYCSASMEMVTLKVGTDRYDYLSSPITRKRFELTVNEKGKLDVYVIPCEGKLKLEISSNWTLISQEAPDVYVGSLTDGRIQGSINNALGTYYVTVSLVETLKNATFQMTTIFTKAGDQAPKNLAPGHDGLLKWERKDGKKIKVIWSPIEYEGGRPYETPKSVEYHVIFTDDEDVQMMTACGMHTAANAGRAKYVGSLYGSEANELEVDLPSNIGFINVIAVAQGAKNMMLGLVVYDPTQIVLTRRRNHGIGQIIFWGAALILLGSVFTAIYFYRKFKKVKQELQYEMTDVRNVASVSSGSIEVSALSTRNRQYSPLVQES